MDKTLGIPHQIDAAIFESFKSFIHGDDKDKKATELDYYVKSGDGKSYTLNPSVVSWLLLQHTYNCQTHPRVIRDFLERTSTSRVGF